MLKTAKFFLTMNLIVKIVLYYKCKNKEFGGYTPSIDLTIIIVLFFLVVPVAFVVEKGL